MSSLTTVIGLAPLVLIPGAGAELYRGVGVVVLAGLLCSVIVTLTFLPALLVSVLAWSQRLPRIVPHSIHHDESAKRPAVHES